MSVALQVVIGAVIGYLCGMFPTGALVGRRFGIDLTKEGSGSTGATNVLRHLGARWAAVVVIGDLFKGALAALLAGWLLGGSPWGLLTWGQVIAAAFAVVGHTFSPLLGFKGGKGILTGGGGLIVLSPPAFLAALVFGMGTIFLTRYVSLGSIVGALVAGMVVLWQGASNGGVGQFLFYGSAVPAFVIVAHRGNIKRLLTGTERKFSRGTTRGLRTSQ
ncbi:MAG: glycerol-3-phosphate 1-O-acyltransferase PlsY [Chloroflexota bacterium]